MYFSFIQTSDLINILIRNTSRSFPLHIRYENTLTAISNQRVSSKYRVEPESIKSNDNDILNLFLDILIVSVTPLF